MKPASHHGPARARSILIANLLAVVLALLTLSLLVFYTVAYGYLEWYIFLPFVAAVFLITVVLNQQGWDRLGRLLFCTLPMIGSLFLTLYTKITAPHGSIIGYFDVRFFIVVSAILPGIVFTFRETRWMVACFVVTFSCLMAYDPLHELLGIGFYQRGFESPFYYYINYIVFLSYSTLVAGILILRWINEQAESASERLIAEKDRANQDLVEARAVIEAQHSAILARNETLEEEVERRTHDLMEYTHQLEQFAFISSHNLRAPVARILGLGQLLELPAHKPEDEVFILTSLVATARELDRVVTDLNAILTIRSADHSELVDIDLWDELKATCATLCREIEDSHAELTVDFSRARVVHSVKSYVTNMLAQLVSNAIRFRHPDRVPHIFIASEKREGYICISLKDNGLGINLDLHGDKLFSLYSRFHLAVSGKGLGLHLVKTQINSLGGKVTVASRVGEGSTFTLFLPDTSL